MSISTRHHYLPQFYLRGFVDGNGTFSVYDYIHKKIKSKRYFPSTHFFDSRNLTEVNDVVTDIPEKLYAKIDEKHSSLIKQIQKEKGVLNLSVDEVLELQEFVSSIFWRIPENDSYYLQEYKDNPKFTENLAIVSKSTGEVDSEITEELVHTDAFMKSIKSMMPIILMYFHSNNNKDLDNWQFCYNPLGDYICTDNPFIFRKDKPKDIFDSEFIFPISRHHLLIRTFNNIDRKEIPAPIMSLIQLLLFENGKKYCASADIERLKLIIEEHKNLVMTNDNLFSILENSEWLDNLHKAWLNKGSQ